MTPVTIHFPPPTRDSCSSSCGSPDLERAGARVVTGQNRELFLEADRQRELPPERSSRRRGGSRPSPQSTQLTATRCYRRLQDLGRSSRGRGGTFVRAGAPPRTRAAHRRLLVAVLRAAPRSAQRPKRRDRQRDRSPRRGPRVIPPRRLPALDLLPLEQLRAAAADAIERHRGALVPIRADRGRERAARSARRSRPPARAR